MLVIINHVRPIAVGRWNGLGRRGMDSEPSLLSVRLSRSWPPRLRGGRCAEAYCVATNAHGRPSPRRRLNKWLGRHGAAIMSLADRRALLRLPPSPNSIIGQAKRRLWERENFIRFAPEIGQALSAGDNQTRPDKSRSDPLSLYQRSTRNNFHYFNSGSLFGRDNKDSLNGKKSLSRSIGARLVRRRFAVAIAIAIEL